MGGSVQGCSRPRYRGIRIHPAAPDLQHCRRGTVHLVLRVDNEQLFQRTDHFRMRLVVGFAHGIQHVKKVFHVPHVVSGCVKVAADTVSVAVGRNGGGLTQDPLDLLVGQWLVVDVQVLALEGGVRLGMESGHGCHGRYEHAHRMRIVIKGLHQLAQVHVHGGVHHDLRVPVGTLVHTRQPAINE